MQQQQTNWWKEGIVYQIYPCSFYDSNGDGIGDLQGIIQKLDHLKKLGVTILWLNPIYKSPNVDNGYDISDYQAILADYGTMADWEQLLAEVHKRDMKLIMDLVVNHTSDQHSWFTAACEGKDNPYRDYYTWRPAKNSKEPNNWCGHFFGSAWQYDSKSDEYYLHLFTPEQPDLNWENPKLRQEIYQMMNWWLAKGIDGFRMDVINMISKDQALPDATDGKKGEKYIYGGQYFLNGPRVHEFIQEMNQKVLTKYDIMTVGECPGAKLDDALLYVGKERNELDMLFQFELMDIDDAIGDGNRWNPKPWQLVDFKRVITHWQHGLHDKGWNANFLMNHDFPRALSRFGNDTLFRTKAASMLATLTLTLAGTPYIYQGEEIGMTNVAFDDIDNYRDIDTLNFYKEAKAAGRDHNEIMQLIHKRSRDNSRTPMQWDNSENAGFTSGTPWIKVNPNYNEINVELDQKHPESIYSYYQKLIALRKENPALIYGEYRPFLEEHPALFVYLRVLNGVKFLVLLNFSEHTIDFKCPEFKYSKLKLILSNYRSAINENIHHVIRPYAARVYKFGAACTLSGAKSGSDGKALESGLGAKPAW